MFLNIYTHTYTYYIIPHICACYSLVLYRNLGRARARGIILVFGCGILPALGATVAACMRAHVCLLRVASQHASKDGRIEGCKGEAGKEGREVGREGCKGGGKEGRGEGGKGGEGEGRKTTVPEQGHTEARHGARSEWKTRQSVDTHHKGSTRAAVQLDSPLAL